MDICVVGVSDRNRSMNGDKVAIEIKPAHHWKVSKKMFRYDDDPNSLSGPV